MAAVSRSESNKKYSWWWDSHISPKNSKWLQENLTDMDSNVKSMIKIIEVDEDTFARRAEMYYKKRPELMKLVEEFYRAYRALAERYDNATDVIQQAHKTMAEAQIPFLMTEDGPMNPGIDSDPHTPEIRGPGRAIFDFDEKFTNGSDLLPSKKEFKVNFNGKARKGLNFNGVEAFSDSERLGRSENDIQSLKEAIKKLEEEKEEGLVEYKKTLERLTKLEFDFEKSKEDSEGFNARANKAEAEVEQLKELLANVEVEREASLTNYRQCLEKIHDLERACNVENEEISRYKAEKEGLLGKYMEALEKLANLENRLLLAEEYSSRMTERAEKAEKEVDTLKESILKLREEKESVVFKYEEALEKIASLEGEIVLIQEEAERLKAEVQEGVDKVKESEEKCVGLSIANVSLRSEVDSLVQRVDKQNEELSEKQKELGTLLTSVQEERMRYTDSEASFQSLQLLHSKVQDELKSVTNELQKKVQLLKQLESQNQELEKQVENVENENNSLNDEKSSLQKEINILKEELVILSQRHQELRVGNSELKQSYHKSTSEIASLVEKLSVMEKLVKKNEILENSLSDLSIELDGTREKVEELEESCHLLMVEKSTLWSEKGTLISQLQMTTENLEKLSQRNNVLENSLFDVNAELEMLRLKSGNLENSCKLLNNQNSVLACKLEDLGKRQVDLEKKYSSLEEERKSTLNSVEELQIYLASEKEEHQLSKTKMIDLENKIYCLQKEGDHMKEEFEEELDNAVNAQFEIFVLHKTIRDLKENNISLLEFCEKLLEASKVSEILILQLEKENLEKSGEVEGLRMEFFGLLDALEGDIENFEDERVVCLVREKVYDMKSSLCEAWGEKHELIIEKSVFVEVIHQLKQNVVELYSLVHEFKEEIGRRNNEVVIQQKETQKLLESNEELILKVRDGNMKEAVLLTEVEKLRKNLFDLQKSYENLRNENSMVIKEKMHLEDEFSCMVGEVVELDNLSFIFKNVIYEKSKTITELTEKMGIIERNLCDSQNKNIVFELSLKNSTEESEEKIRFLNVELEKGKDEVKLWEALAGTFFSELQSCSVREALVKEKFAEVVKAYEALEDESYSKCMDIEKLRERVEVLEGENLEIKKRLASDLNAIMSLKESVSSLEKHAISFKNVRKIGDGDVEEYELSQDSDESQPGESINLHKVQAKIQTVEKAIIELKQHAQTEYTDVRSDLDSALRQIEDLKSQGSSRRGTSNGKSTRRALSQSGGHSRSESVNGPNNSEPMKDIVLDQASDNNSSFGQQRNRKITEISNNDHVFELWETVDRSGSIDLTVGKKGGRPSSVEKEVCVDELVSSRRFRNVQNEDNKRKTLERLASDVQKLTNLQITVRDLREKLDSSENSENTSEADGLKVKLTENEETILKLFNYSAKVMKNIENSTSPSSSSSSIADSIDGSAKKKKSMEQARRISEKIGQLQMEIQKIQFMLMKIENNKVGKVGTRVIERNSRALLRDYLYAGGSKTPRRRKKSRFCGCVQPATRGSD